MNEILPSPPTIESLIRSACDHHMSVAEAAKQIRELMERDAAVVEALRDMLSGWRYIREVYGDLYGVGWDRAQQKAESALARSEAPK